MAKGAELIKVSKIQPREYPKLIIALVIFFGALFFILNQFGIFRGESTAEGAPLDIEPLPASVDPRLDLSDIKSILPCDNPRVIDPKPGKNCLTPYYSPGADPITEPEGRDDPFQPF